MTVDKEFWKKFYFEKDNFPQILCPTCEKGYLKPVKGAFYSEETADSKNLRDREDWSPMWVDCNFVLMLKCDHTKCGDINACSGKGGNEPDMEYDSSNDLCNVIFKPCYVPRYFIPALKIIRIKDNYPNQLSIELNNSFSHFFSDLTSCANKIRICIEIILDKFKVKKTRMQRGKRRNLNLHYRILEFKTVNAEVADFLLAIKWIGNSGSHYDTLTMDDVLDAYRLLDYSLDKLFDDKEMQLIKLTKAINKKKAPLSKKKRHIISALRNIG